MKKQYKIQLPKGKKVTNTKLYFEDGVMTVNVELENRENFHEAIHNEVCGVFGKINNQWKEVLKANGITREKIEEMAKESIKELEKDCPDIWDRMIQEYGEAICGKTEQKYEPKDGDFIHLKWKVVSLFPPFASEVQEEESYVMFNRTDIFDNAVECIGWLIGNGHFNKEFLIEQDNEL